MAVVLVDFDTTGGRDFAVVKPIGVWVAPDEGGVFLRYTPEVEDGSDSGYDNYLRTLWFMEPFIDAWRSGQGEPEGGFARLLTYLTETSYLGTSFRTIARVEVDLTEAYDRFVVMQEPLPVQEEFERVI